MTSINIIGPGGPGLHGLACQIIKAVSDTDFLIKVETYGSPAPDDADYSALLDEVNRGKSDNEYGNILISVNHAPWGG